MKVLTTSASAQNIDVIPRAYASSYTLKLRDTSKNKEVFSASVSASDSGNFKRLSATISPVLKEGRYYDMSLISGSATVYKDKVFCTDQTINQANNNKALKKIGKTKDIESLRDALNEIFEELGPNDYNKQRLEDIIKKAKQLQTLINSNLKVVDGSANFDIDDWTSDWETVTDIMFRINSIKVVNLEQLKTMNDLHKKHSNIEKLIKDQI